MGQRLGDPADPLLVCVRSGAKFSMPGMMDTVLNIGLTDESVHGLAKQSGNERFAWDSYRRLIQMFGKTVLGIDGETPSSTRWTRPSRPRARPMTWTSTPPICSQLAETFKEIVREHAGQDFPQDPREQMDLAIAGRVQLVEHRAAPCSTAARNASRPTWAPRSTSSRWCSATSAPTPAPASRSPVTRPPASRASTATTCRTPRARMSSPASATRSRCRTWRRSTRPPTTS